MPKTNMIAPVLPGIYTDDYPAEFAAYNTQFPGEMEIIGGQIWDTQTYVSGTTTRLDNWFNRRATIDLSNMTLANQLPAPSAFLIRAIRFFVKQRVRLASGTVGGAANPQAGAIDNVAQLINTGVWVLTIGDKPYSQVPAWMLTAGGGAYGVLGFSGTAPQVTDYAQNGIPDPRAVYSLSKPLFMAPQINFSGLFTWPTALTLAGGDTDITVCLDGDLIRPVQ